MVQCSSCGKAIERIPNWMQGIKVEYVCNNCPNRQLKNIAFINLDSGLHASAKIEAEPEVVVEVADEEEEAAAE